MVARLQSADRVNILSQPKQAELVESAYGRTDARTVLRFLGWA